MEKKTPLYDVHAACGGKIVPFAGYLLPVQYGSGVIAEHMAVREAAGLFDVSHMGEVVFSGKDALANINNLFVNDFTNMTVGQVRYSPMCNPYGGIIDDLIVYKKRETEYFVVINASNRDKDVLWMRKNLIGDVIFEDISDSVAQLALQGPKAVEIMERLVLKEFLPAKYYHFIDNVSVNGIECLVSRTGYTGEDGFELYCSPRKAAELWETLMNAGKDYGLIPCGLGARDTLRLEAAMPLYSHEMTDEITPYEAALGNYVKASKSSFIGKKALEGRESPSRKRVGLRMTDRGIAREHEDVYSGDVKIGFTTSGTHCPYLKQAVAMAILGIEYCQPGTVVEIDVRGRRLKAEVVALPFYSRKK